MKTKSLTMIYFLIFFLLNVAPSLQGLFSVIGLDLPLVIPLGEDAVLPCHLSPQINAENMTIRWFKDKYQNLVHLYRKREDQYKNQMAEYRSRTTLIKDGIKAGSVSLIIHNVRPSDGGFYSCFYDTGFFYEEAVVELKVAALGSKPHIHLEEIQHGGIAVVCESSGWYPEPEALWRDGDGNNISSSSEVKAVDGSVLFHVKATHMFNGHPSALSCCIRNTILSEWKQSTVNITDAFFQRISSCILSRLFISAFVTGLAILLIPWIIYLLNEQRELSEELGRLLEERGRLPEERVTVTLDPDTAHPRLLLSEGGRQVRQTETEQPLPDTPKRFTSWPCVAGSEGFTSGRHYWEVQLLREGALWHVGVAAESVNRKGGFTWSPEGGVWAVRGWEGQYWALTSPLTPLSPRDKPQKLGVYLDYEGGRLSLYNADSMELLYSFPRAPFTQRLFPIFGLGVSVFNLWGGSELSLV